MSLFARLIAPATLLLFITHFIILLGVITSFIWLIVLGEWRLILVGLVLLIFGIFILMILIAPSMGILFLLFRFFNVEKINFTENKLNFIFFMLGIITQRSFFIAGVTIWGIGILHYFFWNSNLESETPALVWSYIVALSAPAYYSYKDEKSGQKNSRILAGGFSIAYILSVLIILLHRGNAFYYDLILNGVGILMFVVMIISDIVMGIKNWYDNKNNH